MMICEGNSKLGQLNVSPIKGLRAVGDSHEVKFRGVVPPIKGGSERSEQGGVHPSRLCRTPFVRGDDTPLCPPLLGGIIVLRSLILSPQINTKPILTSNLTT